jgi:hypothetical protein
LVAEILAEPVYKTLKISTTERAEATCEALATLVIEMISWRAARANSAASEKEALLCDTCRTPPFFLV